MGLHGVTPERERQPRPTTARTTGDALQFTDDGALPGAPEHHYAALVGRRPGPGVRRGGRHRRRFRGPQPGHVVHGQRRRRRRRAPATTARSARAPAASCATAVTVPAGGSQDAVGRGRRLRPGPRRRAERAGRRAAGPGRRAGGQDRRRATSSPQWSQVSLPGDPLLQNAIDWGKQNLADLTQTASDLQIRWTNQGKQFPPPLGHRRRTRRWFGAGFPDYPWIFATDGEYTAFAAVALGQFETAEDHLRALRDISDVLNDRSGIVVHEAVSDGSVWFGHDSQTTAADGTKTNDFNTDETIKFPSAVALIWRWTGDNRFRDEMYDFAKRNLQVRRPAPRRRPRRLARGLGQRRAHRAWARRSSTTPSTTSARSTTWPTWRGPSTTARPSTWATNLARKLQRAVRGHVVGRGRAAVRRLADRPGQRAVLPEALDRPGADGGRADATATRRRRASRPTTTAPPRWPGARTRASAATGRAAAACSTPAAAAARTARATSRSSR